MLDFVPLKWWCMEIRVSEHLLPTNVAWVQFPDPVHMWAQFVLVLDPAPRVFFWVLRFFLPQQMPPHLFVIEWLPILMLRRPWEQGCAKNGIKRTSYKACTSLPFRIDGTHRFWSRTLIFHGMSPRVSLMANCNEITVR